MDITLDPVSFRVDPQNWSRFWKDVARGGWEPGTFRFFREAITPETRVIDVGAWIGPTALYSAQLGASCIAFEPDPVAYAELERNVAANDGAPWMAKLTLRNEAVAAEAGELTIGSRSGGGDSTSSALFADRETAWTVTARTLPEVLEEAAPGDAPIFIKIDIEGGEYSLVPALKDVLARPNVTAHISLHPNFLKQSIMAEQGATEEDEAVREAFASAHERILDALPEGRNLTAGKALNPLDRHKLMKRARRSCVFPKEVHIL
ncbi:MAG: FkbM family methyltransferase [Pseudomonadota bacterium]